MLFLLYILHTLPCTNISVIFYSITYQHGDSVGFAFFNLKKNTML